MKDDINKITFDFISKIFEDETLMCDWYEIQDGLKISDEELSKTIKELKRENKIIAKEGEYLPILKDKENK